MNFAISMKHKEAHTDLWVYELLKEAGLDLDPQGSTIPEVEQALKTASKKGTKGHPLTDGQKANNRWKSKTRCRVEHVFGFMEQTMGGLIFCGVGMVRAKANIALTNLVYNMCRLVQIKKYHAEWIVC